MDGFDRIEWLDGHNQVRSVRATSSAVVADVDPRRPARRFPKFRTQSNYVGRYWFTRLGAFVPHESMAEYSTLMLIDHLHDIVGIVPQPVRFTFAAGGTHIPDYLAVHATGRRLLIDVHSAERSRTAADSHFEQTAKICARIGWDYEVFDALDEVTRLNLEFIARYQHPRYAAGDALRSRILSFTSLRPTFGQLRGQLATARVGEHLPAVYHAMWMREIRFRMDKPITDRTELWRG